MKPELVKKEGIGQGHFYRPGDLNGLDPVPKEELPGAQKQTDNHPLPDGTAPPSKTSPHISNKGEEGEGYYSDRPTGVPKESLSKGGPELRPQSSKSSRTPNSLASLSPDEAKRLQHESETSIPASVVAELPDRVETQGINADMFYLRQARASPVMSSLPRVKMPRQTEGDQGPSGETNSNVFYTTSKEDSKTTKVPEKVAVPEQESGVEGLDGGLFHSRRAKSLFAQLPGTKEKTLEKIAKTRRDGTKLTEGGNQGAFCERASVDPLPDTDTTSPAIIGVSKQERKGIQDLAPEIPKDTGKASNTFTEQVWIPSPHSFNQRLV